MTTPLTLTVGAPDDVIAAALARNVVLPDVYYNELQAQARAMAFTISGLASLEQIQFVKDSLDDAFKNGDSFTAWRKRVLAGEVSLSLPRYRQETIFRTNMQTVYNAGRGQQAKRNYGTHPFLMYSAVNDSRTRPTHRAMSGTILPAIHPWWNTHRPPNGFNCRCVVISLTVAEAKRRGGITLDPTRAQPDNGFDYDPWREPQKGLYTAISNFQRRATKQFSELATSLIYSAMEIINKK